MEVSVEFIEQLKTQRDDALREVQIFKLVNSIDQLTIDMCLATCKKLAVDLDEAEKVISELEDEVWDLEQDLVDVVNDLEDSYVSFAQLQEATSRYFRYGAFHAY